jgi:diketogulonate reductase-like aldo/keto reductase
LLLVPGTTNIKRFDENMGALGVEISKEDDQKMRHLISNTEVKGGRYPEAFSKSLFVDTVKA